MVRAHRQVPGRRRRSCAGWLDPHPANARPARPQTAARAQSACARARGVAREARPVASLGSLLSGGLPRLPVLDQRQRDVLGLALVAAACSWASCSTDGWNGGRAGHAVAVALGWTLGRARVLAPVALVVGGGALLLRPVLPGVASAAHRRAVPVRSGHARARRRDARAQLERRRHASRAWASAHLQSHGGVVGEALYQLTHRLVQDVGVDILVVFLALTGVILLTGASIASVLRATGSGAARHHHA